MVRLAWLKSFFREFAPLLMGLGLVLVAETAIAQPFIVPSGSMEPTLLVGDELLASKFAYGYSKFSSPIGLMPNFGGRFLDRPPRRGDVVVFRLPRDPSQTYVKRLIGLPGDRVQMRQGQLYINDTLVPRRADGHVLINEDGRLVDYMRSIETLPGGCKHVILTLGANLPLNSTPEFTVPPGHYFMMGDNRDNSLDSRVSAAEGGVGLVPAENLIGRADVVLFSINPLSAWSEVLERPAAFRLSRLFDRVE
jgi:signal peptidase I